MNDFSEVKAGDKIVVCSRWWKSVETVDKVTPKGSIRVGERLFGKDGHLKTSDPWNHTYLRLATPELLEEIRQREIISKANNAIKNATLTYDQAVKILEIL